MKYYKFSIVIANYNYGKYLESAILSVINQNYSSKELIIIDGGSSDNSVEIIQKYQKDIDYWVSEKDQGQSDAFNKGFDKASGDYYFWLNADDFLLSDALWIMNKSIHHHKHTEWFCFNTLYIDESNTVLRAYRGLSWCHKIMKNLGPQVDAATSVFSKEMYEASLKFDLKLYWAMDNDLWYQFMNKGYTYKRINHFIYAFRIHGGSKTMKNGFKFERSEEQVAQTNYLMEKNNFYPNYRYMPLNRLYKLFTILIPTILSNWKYKRTVLYVKK